MGYFSGPGVDEPIIWYEGAAMGSNARTLSADHQGSIMAVANASSAVLAINTYGAYGAASPSNLGRFSYTGQITLPEFGLYHYKARASAAKRRRCLVSRALRGGDPRIGRFLQTDPVGYEDQLNLYAYVGNDPVNKVDPSGMRNCEPEDINCIETPESAENPSEPEDNPDETDEKDEIVVTAQRRPRNTSGDEEKFFVVTPSSFEQRRLRQRDIRCPGREPVTVGVADPLPAGASAAHSHPASHQGIPGPGDNNFGNTSNTAYVITPSRAFAIDRASNGTYRTRVLSGETLSASERAKLIGNMQNWESGNSSDGSKTYQQRFCQ